MSKNGQRYLGIDNPTAMNQQPTTNNQLTNNQVTEKDTALAHGSGTLKVFATPAMVALMEKAAWKSMESRLEEGQTTVGTEISIKHIKATPMGDTVEAKAELVSAEGRKLSFKVEAFDSKGKIGFGTHTRYVVDEKPFLESLEQ